MYLILSKRTNKFIFHHFARSFQIKWTISYQEDELQANDWEFLQIENTHAQFAHPASAWAEDTLPLIHAFLS